MVIVAKTIAILNISSQDGPIIIFPIEQMSRFQARAYGESMECIRLDEPVFGLGAEGFRQNVKCFSNNEYSKQPQRSGAKKAMRVSEFIPVLVRTELLCF